VSRIPPADYVQRRQEQINAAIVTRSGEMLVGILQLIAAEGYPEFAGVIRDHLIEQGLNNLLARARGQVA
jgi:hypothetical protein